MSTGRFFERIYAAVGRHLAVDRETLDTRLAGVVAGLRCGAEASAPGNERWIAELAVNLMARLYPRLSVAAPPSVADELAAIARAINPAIDLVDAEPTFCVATRSGGRAPDQEILAGADGWVATLGLEPASSTVPNPYAASAAAALAVAVMFQRVFSPGAGRPSPGHYSLSLLDYSPDKGRGVELGPHALGDVTFVGAGAVGNAALWPLLRDETVAGALTVVDPEQVDLSNLQRYVLAMDADVGAHKTELVARAPKAGRMSVHGVRSVLEDSTHLALVTAFVSVDSVQARRHVQALLPRLVVNGWTSDTGLGASWHEFGRDAACLACLYHPTSPSPSQTELVASALKIAPERAARMWLTGAGFSRSEMREVAATLGVPASQFEPWVDRPIQQLYSEVVCGMVGVDIKGTGQLEAVPLAHQSALAGILAAAELVKRTDARLAGDSQTATLVAWHDVLRPPPSFWLQPCARASGCICGDPIYQRVYRDKWAKTT